MSYKNLEIWQMARQLSIDIHKMTLTELPKFETYEEASQIRRSMKSVRSNIVEGYGRKKYQQEYYKHLIYAMGSNSETLDHLETLFETESLKNKVLFDKLSGQLEILGKKINLFLQAIESGIQETNQKQIAKSKKPTANSQQPEALQNKISL
jgi:four helix bundle protein